MIVQKDLTPEKLAGSDQKYAVQRERRSARSPMENTAAEEIAGICKDYVQKN